MSGCYNTAMIADRIERLERCFRSPDAGLIAEFLDSLTPEAEEGEHALRGRDILAMVSRYETKARETAYPEAHREYADIQLLLSGREYIEWFPLEGLSVREPYDPSRDVGFFERPDDAGARVLLTPGVFAFFAPEDAHMPQLMTEAEASPVTKVVVKVRAGLLD